MTQSGPESPAGSRARAVGRTLGAGARVAGRGARGAARVTGRAGRFTARQARRAADAEGAGDSGLARLIELHAFNAAGDTAVAISRRPGARSIARTTSPTWVSSSGTPMAFG
jgi:hypothetical protein